jgi:hypothetical protein
MSDTIVIAISAHQNSKIYASYKQGSGKASFTSYSPSEISDSSYFPLLPLRARGRNVIAGAQTACLGVLVVDSYAGRGAWPPYCSYLHVHKRDACPPCLGIIKNVFS